MPSDLTVGNWRAGASKQLLQLVSQVEASTARGRGPTTGVESSVLGFVNLLDGYDQYVQELDMEQNQDGGGEVGGTDEPSKSAYDILANQSGPTEVKDGKNVNADEDSGLVIDEANKPLPVGFGQIEQVQEANATDGASSPVVAADNSDNLDNADNSDRRQRQEEAQPQPNPFQVDVNIDRSNDETQELDATNSEKDTTETNPTVRRKKSK